MYENNMYIYNILYTRHGNIPMMDSPSPDSSEAAPACAAMGLGESLMATFPYWIENIRYRFI